MLQPADKATPGMTVYTTYVFTVSIQNNELESSLYSFVVVVVVVVLVLVLVAVVAAAAVVVAAVAVVVVVTVAVGGSGVTTVAVVDLQCHTHTHTISFVGGNLRNNLMTGDSFLFVEKQSGGEWESIYTDADWETKLGTVCNI